MDNLNFGGREEDDEFLNVNLVYNLICCCFLNLIYM